MQTLKDIALELLEKYRVAQDSVIWEYSGRIEEEEKELDEEVEKYRVQINTVKSPVVHGEWKETMDAHIGIDYLCTACRKLTHTAKQYDIYGNEYVYEFCPHCGARMDGET